MTTDYSNQLAKSKDEIEKRAEADRKVAEAEYAASEERRLAMMAPVTKLMAAISEEVSQTSGFIFRYDARRHCFRIYNRPEGWFLQWRCLIEIAPVCTDKMLYSISAYKWIELLSSAKFSYSMEYGDSSKQICAVQFHVFDEELVTRLIIDTIAAFSIGNDCYANTKKVFSSFNDAVLSSGK